MEKHQGLVLRLRAMGLASAEALGAAPAERSGGWHGQRLCAYDTEQGLQ